MNFTKKAVNDQLEDITYGDEKEANQRIHRIKFVIMIGLLLCVLSGAAAAMGMLIGIIDNAPDIDTLDFSPSGYATTTYDTEGSLVATLVQEGSNREEASFEEIPENLINAFVAIEDQRFWVHNGIDFKSISRAVKGVLTGDSSAGGGSTITQQLIKNNVFSGGNEKGFMLYERKFQEWYIALRLENQPGKDKEEIKKQIITNYLNTINLGNNTLGVKVAAERYFGKEVSELNLAECTVLASITKNPSRLNPLTHPEDNQERRLQVLKDMVEQGYITEADKEAVSGMEVYDEIKNHDSYVSTESQVYSYFTDALIDQVQRVLIDKLELTAAEAKNMLYSGGLKIMTTQNPKLQQIVDEEVNDPDNYDTAKYSYKWRCSIKHKDKGLIHYSEKDADKYFRQKNGSSYDGLYKSEAAVQSAVEEYKATIYDESAGDEIIAETLDTTLEPQVSFVLMDQKTKEVLALCGGRGEKKYSLTINRATNTYKQPGSVFKVVTAFAPAIEECGATLGTCYYDNEFTLGNKTFKNWWKSGNYFGYSSIRDGIEFSMNIVAVKCMYETVTPKLGVEFAKKLGISSLTEEDENVATALGGITKGVTNLELTDAFAAIADGGLYGEAKLFTKIYDRKGNLLIDMDEEKEQRVMKETTAFLLTDALKRSTEAHTKWAGGYTINNTSSRAHLDNMATAGKSGTTSNNNDVWFVGFTPYYTAGVWGGCDDNQSLSDAETGEYNGGTSFHKNIWKKIMTRVHEGLENTEFEKPDGIVELEVCRKSGKLPHSGCYADYRSGSNAVYTEYFDIDNIPTEACDHHNSWGGIIIPSDEKGSYTDDGGYYGHTEEKDEENTSEETSEETGSAGPSDSSSNNVIVAPGVNMDGSSHGPGGGSSPGGSNGPGTDTGAQGPGEG